MSRVTFPEGVHLAEQSSDCALLLANDQGIARVNFKGGRYITPTPPIRLITARTQGSSGGGFVDGVLDIIEGVGEAIKDAIERVIRGIDDIF